MPRKKTVPEDTPIDIKRQIFYLERYEFYASRLLLAMHGQLPGDAFGKDCEFLHVQPTQFRAQVERLIQAEQASLVESGSGILLPEERSAAGYAAANAYDYND